MDDDDGTITITHVNGQKITPFNCIFPKAGFTVNTDITQFIDRIIRKTGLPTESILLFDKGDGKQRTFTCTLSGDVKVFQENYYEGTNKRKRVGTKCGSDWTQEELEAFGIKISNVTMEKFSEDLNIPNSFKLSDEAAEFIASCKEVDSIRQKSSAFELQSEFARRLFLIIREEPNMESAVDDMIFVLLQSIGFSKGRWLVRSRREAPLQMSGAMTEAVADFVILDIKTMRSIRVAVIEDKSYSMSTKPGTKDNAEAQLVAEGVAATQVNIKTAKKAQQEQSTSTGEPHEESKSEGQPPHTKEVMLLIRVLGTEVTFYYGDLMELANSVAEGNPVPSGCKIHRLSHPGNRPFDLQVSADLQAVVEILDKMKHFLSSS